MALDIDEQFYLIATEEVEGANRKAALWAKAMALSNGDTNKAKYKYIEDRARQLSEADLKSGCTPEFNRDDYITAAEFSEITGLSESYIATKIKDGHYKGIEKNNSFYVHKREYQASNYPLSITNDSPGESQSTHSAAIQKDGGDAFQQKLISPSSSGLSWQKAILPSFLASLLINSSDIFLYLSSGDTSLIIIAFAVLLGGLLILLLIESTLGILVHSVFFRGKRNYTITVKKCVFWIGIFFVACTILIKLLQ